MENIIITINIILAIILVILILLQKSEGGALGIGVSQDNFMFSRSAGDFMTKATAVVATLFIICSLGLTIISRGELTPTMSVIDKTEENTDDAPEIPEQFERWATIWNSWHSALANDSTSATTASLHFLLQYPQIDQIIVGVDSVDQLRQLIEVSRRPVTPQCLSDMASSDEDLVDPSTWIKP